MDRNYLRLDMLVVAILLPRPTPLVILAVCNYSESNSNKMQSPLAMKKTGFWRACARFAWRCGLATSIPSQLSFQFDN